MEYLGYFLKPNNYKVVDWNWLVQKFEKRISNWLFRWISIGGRLILVKYVFEGVCIFWLSLAYFPNTILNRLRKRMFSFIKSSNALREKFHLASWEFASKPKHLGG